MKNKNILSIGSLPPPYDGQSIAYKTAIEALQYEFRVRHVQTSLKSKSLLISFSLLVKYFSLILYNRAVYRPDIVYFLCSRTVVGSVRDFILLLIFYNSKVKIVNHIHGSGLDDFLKNLPRFYKKLLVHLYSKVDRHIILTKDMVDQLQEIPGACNKSVVIPNFYDDSQSIECININKNTYKKGPIRLIYLSGICTTKGVFDVIEAFKILTGLGIPAHLKIVGGGIDDCVMSSKDVMEKLEKVIRGYEDIELLGVVTGKEKYKLLAESHVFILPSYYASEAVPLSIIEAMRMGCCIIVSRYKYLPSIVKTGVNGYNVKVKNPEEIVRTIEDLYNNYDKFNSISLYNVSHAKESYSGKRYMVNILKEIKTLC
jgi:glycosyltransferase involved in cell wall biosynthesis